MRGQQLGALLACLLLLGCARGQVLAQTPVVRAYDTNFNEGIRLANGEHVFTGGGEWLWNVIQMDSLGEVLWARQISPDIGYLDAPVGTADGHVLVSTTHNGPGGFGQPAVLCFDHEGNLLWAKTYVMTDTMRVSGLVRTTDGMNLPTAMWGSASAPRTVLVKIHDDGAVEWARSTGDDWSVGFVTPLTNGELLLDGLVLVDADGNVEWSAGLDGFGQQVVDAAETPSGNLVVMTGNGLKQGVDEFTLFTMDRNGQRLAGRSYDTGPIIADMLNEGDVLVNPLGQIAVLARMTSGLGCTMMLLDSTYNTVWSTRYWEDPFDIHWVLGSGNEAWLSMFGAGPWPGELHRIPLATAPEGACYLPPIVVPGSTFTGPVPFPVTLSPYAVDTTSFITTTTILQVTPMPFPCLTTSVAGIVAQLHPALSPNPASDHVRVTGMAARSPWAVHDTAGRALLAGTLSADGRIRLQGLAAGVYVVVVHDAQITWSSRLVVE